MPEDFGGLGIQDLDPFKIWEYREKKKTKLVFQTSIIDVIHLCVDDVVNGRTFFCLTERVEEDGETTSKL